MRSGMALLQVTCCFLLLHTSSVCEGVVVLRFQEDRVARSETQAWYQGHLDPDRHLHSVTLCARFFLFTLHGRSTFFMLTNAQGHDGILKGDLWVDRVRPVLAQHYNFQPLKEKLWAYRWHHLCFTYDHEKHRISTYVDGRLNNHQDYEVMNTMAGDRVRLGQGTSKQPQRSFSGDLTQVNVWDRPLREDEVQLLAECEDDLQGNYVSWDVGWRLEQITSYKVPLSDLCKSQAGPTYFWFPSLSIETALYLCQALGTRLPSGTDMQEVDAMVTEAETKFPKSHSCYTDHWVALNDIVEEGVWRIGDTVEEDDILWAPLEPNGVQYENCASRKTTGIHDVNCYTSLKCTVCPFTDGQRFSLLGTCEKEDRNVYFMVFQHNVSELLFVGYGAYQIHRQDGVWTWANVVNNITIAHMEESTSDYPMGRRWWRLEQPVCGQQSGELKKLLFTPCSPQHFTCNDATCVQLQHRCDLKYDCRDNSDELNCQIVTFPDDYQKHLPPRNPVNPKSSLGIVFSITVEFLGVHTLAMTMEVSYKLKLTWVDSRLHYQNLKVNDTMNILPAATMQELWTPQVSFINTMDNKHTIIDEDTTILVSRQGEAVGRDETAPAEVDIYPGGRNTLTVRRKYGTVFTCKLDLSLYPFDIQECIMHFRITSATKSFLVFDLAASSVLNFANKHLVEYEVGTLRLEEEKEEGDEFSNIKVMVPLKRRYGYAILNVYIPTLVLLIVNYVTLFFRPSIFDVRMMSALTVQLVIATLFSQMSASLPKTSYFKMVDVWFIFCIGITFLTIIFHVLVDGAINQPRVRRVTQGPSKPRFGLVGVGGFGAPVNVVKGPVIDDTRGQKTVAATKLTVLAAFVVFNVCYWGYILV